MQHINILFILPIAEIFKSRYRKDLGISLKNQNLKIQVKNSSKIYKSILFQFIEHAKRII